MADRRPRQQYHYLYGSTDDREVQHERNVMSSPTPEQDSLVGEDFVPTDAEEDNELNSPDLQQLLITNGNSVPVTITNEKLLPVGFREKHPVLYGISITGTVALFFFIAAVLFFPDSWIASIATTPKSELTFVIPFPKVTRERFNDSASNIIQKDLFDPSLHYRGALDRDFIFPFPTGAFWTNLVLQPTADRGLSYPITVYPYAYKWSDTLLQVSYPAAHRKELPKEIHDYFFPDLTFEATEGTSRRHITNFDPLSVTLRYWTNTANGFWETFLVQGSPYVTIHYDNATPLIRAFSIFSNVFCPRDDVSYTKILDGTAGSDGGGGGGRQRKRRLNFGICSTEPDGTERGLLLRGVQFILESQEGMHWMVFSSEPIELRFDTEHKTTVTSTSRFKGVLRLALIPSTQPQSKANVTSQIFDSTGLQRLIYHAGIYPVSAEVSWTFRSNEGLSNSIKMAAKSITGGALNAASAAGSTGSTSSSSKSESSSNGRTATVYFTFMTKTFSPASSGTTPKELLMLALPHHAQNMPPGAQLATDQFDLYFKCIKGPMRPVLGSMWSYDEPLPSIGFDKSPVLNAPRKEYLHPAVKKEIVQTLREDVRLALPTTDENVYGFGKQSARLAQLAHIAHALLGMNSTYNSSDTRRHSDSKNDSDELQGIFDEAVSKLSSVLEQFLAANVSDYLVYDLNLGGVVSIDGISDTEGDFGNGRYNDHHFQYGYLLYACAILGKIKPSFVEDFGHYVDAIYYDIANDGNFDSSRSSGVFYPASRHKVWFDGHSFASGLFPFGNGKSQESSSEAVNGYFGAYLWSLVRHDAAQDPDSDTSTQTDFVRLLLASEIRGAQLYWHMKPSVSGTNRTQTSSTATVYSPQFSQNYMVGNLGMMDAIASTWFGTSPLYVHMINEIPVTAITETLFDKPYVTQEYSQVLEPLGQVEMAWQGYVVCNHAIVDPQAAWAEALKLFSPELDSAISKSQVLYWVATRPGFNASLATSTTAHASDTGSDHAHSERPSRDKSETSSENDGGSEQCASHTACKENGLTGSCCPTSGGIMLDCCSKR